jgi:Asp-tRNA(Asn)/Glu-tRNA(Gln) amidotransferase A subunit family amidase
VLELNPSALSEAAKLDEERAAGRKRGDLHGIPILLKASNRIHITIPLPDFLPRTTLQPL